MIWLWIAGIFAAILVFNFGFQLFFSRPILRIFEKQLPLTSDYVDPSSLAERIEFPTTGNLHLRGNLQLPLQQSPRGLVVFCPELNGSHWSANWYCQGLLKAGFVVLAFDFRSQGESDCQPGYEPLHWVTDYEVADVNAALQYVMSREDLQGLDVGLMGISRGGGAALAAAAENEIVHRVATEGAFSTAAMHLYFTTRWASMYIPDWIQRWIPEWHLRWTLAFSRWISQRRRNCRYTKLERLLPKLRNRPTLLIAGRSDSYVPQQIPEAMAARIGGSQCELWIVRKAKHNRARNVDPATYDSRLVAFFSPENAVTTSDDRQSHQAEDPPPQPAENPEPQTTTS